MEPPAPPAPRTNPLLSSAVTGLSLQDLTHRAVPLPVLRRQPDFEIDRPESTPLGNTFTLNNSQPKDNNSIKPPLHNTNQENKSNPPTSSTNVRKEDGNKKIIESKAFAKSDDEFDVNEYFARLQSTRYVSAPKDLKEDKNANLEETEENLEEINLLDDSRSNSSPNNDSQQSLTADIAQNFSQLPQVLPQVASAVFNSFSNILNLNKRDPTPVSDVYQYAQQDYSNFGPGYGVQNAYVAQDTQVHGSYGSSVAVPMFTPDNAAGFTPSNEERAAVVGPPPIGGPNNTFRMASKKKTYAHIPGLTGSGSHTAAQGIQLSVNLPPKPPSWDQSDSTSQLYTPQSTSDAFSSQMGRTNPVILESNFVMTTAMPDTSTVPLSPASSSTTLGQLSLLSSANAAGDPNSKASFYAPVSSTTATILDPTVITATLNSNSVSATLEISDSTSTEKKYAWKPNSDPPSTCSAVMTEISDTHLSKDFIPKYEDNLPTSELNEANSQAIAANYDVCEIHDAHTAKPGESNVDLFASAAFVTSNTESIPPPPILPPPTAIPARNQCSVDRSILPPSIARRLANTNPTSHSQPISELNIFVPRPPSSTNIQSIESTSISSQSTVPTLWNVGPQIFTPPKIENAILEGSDISMVPLSENESAAGLPRYDSFNPEESMVNKEQQIAPQTSNKQAPVFFNPSAFGQSLNFTLSSNTYGVPPTHGAISTPGAPATQGLMTSQTTVPPNSIICQPIEEPKPPIKEPPKLPPIGQNFRLGSKKKLQYYSGPIEGTGHIGNMVVPTLDPVFPTHNVDSNVALFTPSLDTIKGPNEEESSKLNQGIEHPSRANVPYDLSKPYQTQGTPFDLGQPCLPPDINQTHTHLPFDLNYLNPPAESSGNYNVAFGHNKQINEIEPQDNTKPSDLFGTLKSKLSSVNINKLHSAVTSLLDPAYYDSGKNHGSTYDFGFGQSESSTKHYDHGQIQPANGSGYGNPQSLHLDVFVPSIEQQYKQQYQYDQNQPNENYTPYHNYHQHMDPQPVPAQINIQSRIQENLPIQTQEMPYVSNTGQQIISNTQHLYSGNPEEAVAQVKQHETTLPSKETKEYVGFKSAWPDSQEQGADSMVTATSPAYLEENSEIKFFNPFGQPGNRKDEDQIGQLQWDKRNRSDALLENKHETVVKQTDDIKVSGVELKDNVKENTITHETPVDLFGSVDDSQVKIGYSESTTERSVLNISTQDNIQSNKNKKRDVTFDKNTSNITAQLIENLTAPIQLFNPVHVPFNETNTYIGEVNRTVDANQFDEISQITEDTIDSIQTHAFENMEVGGDTIKDNESNMFFDHAYGYGWSIKPEDKITDHGSISGPNVIGFRDDSLNNPANASVEMKAVLHHSQDEVEIYPNHAYLTRQMSVPSAPSAADLEVTEEEYSVTKDDADVRSILDVNLIEEDARSDFDEFEHQSIASQNSRINLIKPWEKDDEKIETEKSVDAVLKVRNTVFGFENASSTVKEIEQTDIVHTTVQPEMSRLHDNSGLVTGPVVSFASYFDTGNYAAETYFKNTTIPTSIGFNTQTMFTENQSRKLDVSNIGFGGHEFGDSNTMAENTPCHHATQGYFGDTVELRKSNEKETYDEIQNEVLKSKLSDYKIASSQVENPANSTTYCEHKFANYELLPTDVTEEDNVSAHIQSLELFELPQENVIDFPKSLVEETKIENKFSVEIKENPVVEIKNTHGAEPKTVELQKLQNSFENDVPLPDPIHFFGQSQEAVSTQDTQPEGSFNLLASYFASPPANTSQRPDPKKSFFELSEGQDHYMHETQSSNHRNLFLAQQVSAEDYYDEPLASNFQITETPKSFFVLSQTEKICIVKGQQVDVDEESNTNLKYLTKLNIPSTFDNGAQFNTILSNTNFLTDVEHLDKIEKFDDDGKIKIANLKLGTPCESLENNKENNKAEFTNERFSQYEEDNFETDINSGAEIEESFIDYESCLAAIINNCDHCANVKVSKNSVVLESGVQKVTVNKSPAKSDVGFKCEAYSDTVFRCGSSSEPLFDREVHSDSFDTGTNPNADFDCEAMDADGREKGKEGGVNLRSNPAPGGKGARQSVTFEDLQEENDQDDSNVNKENADASPYRPVRAHWFYRLDREGKSQWRPFSAADSGALEKAYNSPALTESTLVATDGGRYDVSVMQRKRSAVYWSDKPTNVRRCSWFYKGTTDARYVPYAETVADLLEAEFERGCATGEWHRRVALPGGESVVMHGATVIVHFLPGASPDSWGNTPQSVMRPRVVRRGADEAEVEEGEPSRVDHLLLLCHGIGSACDLRFRPVEEVVDDFRATSLQLVQSHYRNSYESDKVGRVEVLPVSWHSTLHSGESGLDRRLATVTLDSIPKLRGFTNDTVLDVLFYTSPVFCQTIMDTVGDEMNRIYELFVTRNPTFSGGVSLGGHSLGSLILFDLLCHQSAPADKEAGKESGRPAERVVGSAGTGQPYITYPQLRFSPQALYALGSPIAIFQCIRGAESLGEQFRLPTCPAFFNIFHPYDPVAYRVEPLVHPALQRLPPSLIPHHKGRKRMHLELKETMARVGADIRQRLTESLRSTWANVWRSPAAPQPSQSPPPPPSPPPDPPHQVVQEPAEEEPAVVGEEAGNATDPRLGRLNGGRRIDYVLQEAPFEIFNEYLFAMTSHVCYWESEDTMLLILREIYDALGVAPDSVVPQQTMTLEVQRRPPPESGASESPRSRDGPSSSGT